MLRTHGWERERERERGKGGFFFVPLSRKEKGTERQDVMMVYLQGFIYLLILDSVGKGGKGGGAFE